MKKITVLLVYTIFFLAFAAPIFAAPTDGIIPIVNFPDLGTVISQALPLVFGLVALFAVVVFSIGAFRYLVSRGDPKAADGARGTMTGAVLGLVIVLGAVSVSGIFQAVFGLGFFGTNNAVGSIDPTGSFDLKCAFRLTTGSCIGTQFPDFGQLITFILLLLLSLGGVAFFFMLMWGGIRYMLARGDEKAVQDARATLTNAAVGLLLMIAAIAIIRLIAQLLFKSGNLISP